ncbi:MAG: carbon-nitrogen hydrolase family protein [Anaerolineae bacterium]|nr:carbon-nitrogen hydrolase family protein [Anaerolineae bacterium]
MREVTVAAVQMHPKLGEQQDNLIRVGEWLDKVCTEQRVDLVVFPELITTGYECGVQFTELAERVPGPTANLIAQRASDYGTHVLFGMVAKEKVESILYNAAVLIGPDGEVVGRYNKVHLRGEERLAFRPGFRYNVWETEFGAIGVMLGWDLAFPEVARSLALEGAELVCACANWENPNADEWRAYLLSRAYENAVYVVGANRVGEEYTYHFFGDSMVVGPRGQVYGTVDGGEEGYVVARIDLDQVRQYREEFQFFQCRQPQTYRSVVKKY